MAFRFSLVKNTVLVLYFIFSPAYYVSAQGIMGTAELEKICKLTIPEFKNYATAHGYIYCNRYASTESYCICLHDTLRQRASMVYSVDKLGHVGITINDMDDIDMESLYIDIETSDTYRFIRKETMDDPDGGGDKTEKMIYTNGTYYIVLFDHFYFNENHERRTSRMDVSIQPVNYSPY